MIHTPLVDMLDEATPDTITVTDYMPDGSIPTGPTVAVWTSNLTLHPDIPGHVYEVEYSIQVLTRFEDPENAEPDLAGTLAEVLGALWGHADYLPTEIKRMSSPENRYHIWALTVTGGLELTPPEA